MNLVPLPHCLILCLSWNPFLWSLCKSNCYHCYGFGSLPSAVKHTALWKVVEPLWSVSQREQRMNLRICALIERTPLFSLSLALSSSYLLSFSPSFPLSFSLSWPLGAGKVGDFSTCHDIQFLPNPWSQLKHFILLGWLPQVFYHSSWKLIESLKSQLHCCTQDVLLHLSHNWVLQIECFTL